MTGDRETASASVVLVGNPNVGKSALFGALTGQYVVVSNYPGTTVEVSRGSAVISRRRTEIVDTPGANSLIPMSEDERVTRDIVLDDSRKVVVQVADSKNLERALVISSQLAELGVPFVLALNMADEAASRGIHVDVRALSQALGVPVVETVATEKRGVEDVISALHSAAVSQFRPVFSKVMESAVLEVQALMGDGVQGGRGIAVSLLSGDATLASRLVELLPAETLGQIEKVRAQLEARHRQPLGYLIQLERRRQIERLLRSVVRTDPDVKGLSRGAGSVPLVLSVPVYAAAVYGLGILAGAHPVAAVLALPMLLLALYLYSDRGAHPVLGVPLVAAVLYLTWLFVGNFGAGTCVDFLEGTLLGKWVNPVIADAVRAVVPWEVGRELLLGDYGLLPMGVTYAFGIVMPIVATFFIVFGLLEDSGYLPRLAVMADRSFKSIGLSGKAVLPMVLGLGCGTMAVLTTRILEGRRERLIVTLLLALGIPCSAQLGVVMGMLGGPSVAGWATAVWAGVVLLVLLTVGFLAGRLMPGESPDFILEVPPARMPRFRNIALKTYARVKWYVKEAVPLFVIGAVVLFVTDKIGLLAALERSGRPVVQGFLGLPPKATEAFLVGFLRRDYGAAALFQMSRAGQLDTVQVVVSLVTMTLFVPCFANFLMVVKERGVWTAVAILGFIVPFAVLVGGLLNWVLKVVG